MELFKKIKHWLTNDQYKSNVSSTDANEAHNNDSISDREVIQQWQVKGTPFTIIKYLNEYFVTLGKYRLTEKMPSKEAAEEYALTDSWLLRMAVMNIMITEAADAKKLAETIAAQAAKKNQMEVNFNNVTKQ